MARRIIHQLVDDLDGEVLEPGTGAEVSFSLDGISYEIDLSDSHAEELREKLAPWIAAGRKTGSAVGAARSGARKGRRASSRSDLAAVRAWAEENSITVSARGRVAGSVLAAYDAAH
jgi:hypothetical protein